MGESMYISTLSGY